MNYAGSAVALLLCASVGSCAHPTPYQAQSASSAIRGGYAEEELSPGHYRVSFSGNSYTSRETVESYMLYRAAELTLNRGFDWFVTVDRETERKVTRRIGADPFYRPWYGPPYDVWLPYWRYRVRGSGWYSWNPYDADPFWADRFDERVIEEFEATVEIRMGTGAMPAGDGHPYDARQVIADIGPRVVRETSP